MTRIAAASVFIGATCIGLIAEEQSFAVHALKIRSVIVWELVENIKELWKQQKLRWEREWKIPGRQDSSCSDSTCWWPWKTDKAWLSEKAYGADQGAESQYPEEVEAAGIQYTRWEELAAAEASALVCKVIKEEVEKDKAARQNLASGMLVTVSGVLDAKYLELNQQQCKLLYRIKTDWTWTAYCPSAPVDSQDKRDKKIFRLREQNLTYKGVSTSTFVADQNQKVLVRARFGSTRGQGSVDEVDQVCTLKKKALFNLSVVCERVNEDGTGTGTFRTIVVDRSNVMPLTL